MAEAGGEIEVWLGLIEATRAALAILHLEELELLAERAEDLLQRSYDRAPGRDVEVRLRGNASGQPETPGRAAGGCDMALLTARHGILGELLGATERNIAVLRRLRGEETNSRWVR